MSGKKMGKGTMDFQVAAKLIVFVVVIGIAVALMSVIINMSKPKAPSEISGGVNSGEQSIPDNSVPPETSKPDESLPPEITYTKVTVDNKMIHIGELALINKIYPYVFPEDENHLTPVYEIKNSSYKVKDSTVKMQQAAVEAMNSMMAEFAENTSSSAAQAVTIITGYRNFNDQDSVYKNRVIRVGEEKASTSVAKAGESDFHTGLSFQLSILTSNSVNVFDGTGDYKWIKDNAYKYGFILRYPADKSSSTEMDEQTNIYRYVGIPHAEIIKSGDYSFEEYIYILKNYRYDSIHISTVVDEKKYEVYYQPADSGDSTELYVPENAVSYTYSGNNIDGFIITALMG